MTAVKISAFGGMIPAREERLLPDTAAAYAENTLFMDGTVRGFRPAVEVRTLTNPNAQRVFRIPNDPYAKPNSIFGNSTWLEFEDPDTSVVRSPVVGDIYGRYYWTSPSVGPSYNTLARIQSGQSAFRLGVPAPLNAPSVSPNGGSSDVTVTRGYVYTWVTEYGEEGPPSPPVLNTGREDDTWTVTVFAPTTEQSTGRNLTKVRIYRTVTSAAGVASYYLVVEQAIASTTYADTRDDEEITATELESTDWAPPPSSLKGMVAMPNGIIAGWTGSDVYFSEPYRPHAWPAGYSVSVDAPIVGLGVIGQSLVVCTTANPTVISGVHPSQMTQQKIAALEPCLSRGSVISTLEGVTYASHNGLVIVNSGGIAPLTPGLITREQWLNEVDPYSLRGVRLNGGYYALHTPRTESETKGIHVNGGEAGFCWITDQFATKHVQTDYWTGEVLTIHDGKVWHICPAVTTGMEPFTWRSKLYQLTKPTNFAVAKVLFTVPDGAPELNPTPNTALEQELADDQYGLFRVYADEQLVYTRELRTSGEVFKLPSGFKATLWQVEVTARVTIDSIELASSAKELGSV